MCSVTAIAHMFWDNSHEEIFENILRLMRFGEIGVNFE